MLMSKIKLKMRKDQKYSEDGDLKTANTLHIYRRLWSVPTVGNPGLVPAQPFLICKCIASIVQNLK